MKPKENFDFPMRLARFLALAGVASRRKSADLIAVGKVSVNGEIVTEPGKKIVENDEIFFQGKVLGLEERTYIMLNKPSGYLCSASDPHAEKIVYDLVDIPGKRLFSVGRLDLNSEGLLILTDDGDFADKLTHPRYEISKKYLVKTDKNLPAEAIRKIEQGVEDEGEKLRAEKVIPQKHLEYIFILKEGKKREIRRLVAALGRRVLLLRRVAVGELTLGNLPLGKWRDLTPEEIALTMQK